MQVVEELEAEGLLHTVRGQGTFIGGREARNRPPFLVVRTNGDWDERDRATYSGFTEQMSRFGANTFSMSRQMVMELVESGRFPACSGIHSSTYTETGDPIVIAPGLPLVGFEGHADPRVSDVVGFDNHGGGQRACFYMHEQGHSRIGFVDCATGKLEDEWSSERARGWRDAMQALELPFEQYFIANPTGQADPTLVGPAAAETFLSMPSISAFVFANDSVAHSFFQRLGELGIPPAMWPACIGFDDLATPDGQVLCSMRLPWDELGRESARVLWSRVCGKLTGPKIHRNVPMQLISRLSCRPGWAHDFSFSVGSPNSSS
jgi:DNA-binding LacI/PurR family transcriptional regulator